MTIIIKNQPNNFHKGDSFPLGWVAKPSHIVKVGTCKCIKLEGDDSIFEGTFSTSGLLAVFKDETIPFLPSSYKDGTPGVIVYDSVSRIDVPVGIGIY